MEEANGYKIYDGISRGARAFMTVMGAEGMVQQVDIRIRFEAEALPLLDAVYRRARLLCRYTGDEDDLVQETFLKAFAKFAQFQAGTNVRAWIMTILTNTFITRLRKEKREVIGLGDLDGAEPEDPAVHFLAPVDFRDDARLRDFLDTPVRAALDALSPTTRAVLLLVALDDLSYQEAADALGIPIGTVMSRLYRARGEMQAALHGYAEAAGLGGKAVGRVRQALRAPAGEK